jgi:hypothetical protein
VADYLVSNQLSQPGRLEVYLGILELLLNNQPLQVEVYLEILQPQLHSPEVVYLEMQELQLHNQLRLEVSLELPSNLNLLAHSSAELNQPPHNLPLQEASLAPNPKTNQPAASSDPNHRPRPKTLSSAQEALLTNNK